MSFCYTSDDQMTQRLEALNAAMQRIADGDFTARLEASRPNTAEVPLEDTFNLMAERLTERRAHLVELDTLKSDCVSSVSHELRTPLTTIKALTRLLMRDDLPDAKRREYLETISVECDRQIDLVLNLLELSRLEGGVFRIAHDRVDV